MKLLYTLIFTLMIGVGAQAAGPLSDSPGSPPFLEVYTVSPNPVTGGFVTVTFKAIDDRQALQIRVFNLIGQEMYKEDVTPVGGEQRMRLDLSAYPKGIYMIEMSDGTNTRIKRVSVI